MDAVERYIPLFVHDCPMVTLHLSIGLESISPDLSQRLGEVFSLLNDWFKITAVVDTTLTADHAKRVAARRDERQLITVASPPAWSASLGRAAARTAVPRRLLAFIPGKDLTRFVGLRRSVNGLVEQFPNHGKPR
ncbi:hypothetical protein Hmuk_3240 (plasmid) [Halomicrobium mukohataei DSM 12286]|uniref:Uncharacterized protein n=1 Tax=Halomicrobium mukohataei (strain ATCC 700874 / DSM 12286 / JCM 9738 / NCIMB 13541) TaxID=485914 RepID=C7P4U7_HALMD|nr:hypothetical protein Hmuk_3240 [Halomicrobium mukohataei DSM 12286]